MGFPAATRTFLAGVAADNTKGWFEANRSGYEAGCVAPALAFVAAMGPRLRAVSPDVQWAAKVSGSVARIHRDTRFSADKRPYKDHLDLWFWHGDRKGWEVPGFFLRITPASVWIGAGQHGLPRPTLERFRAAVLDPVAGTALEAAVVGAGAAGLEVGEGSRKRVPAGYPADHPRARFLLFDSLHALATLPGAVVEDADFDDRAFEIFRQAWPVGQWLRDWV
jgi:uncharacterized protein (TIGR02453 family)